MQHLPVTIRRLLELFLHVGPASFQFRYALGVSPVPERQTWLLMLAGSAVLVARTRRRKA